MSTEQTTRVSGSSLAIATTVVSTQATSLFRFLVLQISEVLSEVTADTGLSNILNIDITDPRTHSFNLQSIQQAVSYVTEHFRSFITTTSVDNVKGLALQMRMTIMRGAIAFVLFYIRLCCRLCKGTELLVSDRFTNDQTLTGYSKMFSSPVPGIGHSTKNVYDYIREITVKCITVVDSFFVNMVETPKSDQSSQDLLKTQE
jgi:hypothetical protein